VLISLHKNYQKLGQIDKSKSRIEELIKNQPTEYEYRLLAEINLAQRNFSKAITNYQEYVKLAKNRGTALVELAHAYTVIQNYPAAITNLRKALVWDDGLINANINLVKLLLMTREFDQAQTQINHIRSKAQPLSVADLLQGDFYQKKKLYKKALKSYSKAHKNSPNTLSVISLYRTYKNLGQFNNARKLLESWLPHEKNKNLKAVIALADIYKILDRNDLVIALFKQQLELYPNSIPLNNNIANALLKNDQPLPAITHAKLALKFVPNNVSVLDTLALAYSASGDDNAALPLYRKALSFDFNNNTVKYHLAITLDKLNRTKAAVDLLIQVVESDRKFSEKQSAKELLDLLAKK